MTTETLTLTDFLLARIAEDEAAARRCAEAFPPPWDVSDRGHSATVKADEPNFWTVTELPQSPSLDGWLGDYLDHIAWHDPARVLAECEAKRRIVEVARYAPDGPGGWGFRRILINLALPYADHPDYRDEWRP